MFTCVRTMLGKKWLELHVQIGVAHFSKASVATCFAPAVCGLGEGFNEARELIKSVTHVQ